MINKNVYTRLSPHVILFKWLKKHHRKNKLYVASENVEEYFKIIAHSMME